MSAKATAADFEAARARLEASRAHADASTQRPPKTAPPARDSSRRKPGGGLKGSRLPEDVQAWIRTELACGASLNGLAHALGVSRDLIRVVRDGTSVRHDARQTAS